jgi:hypothetical protein
MSEDNPQLWEIKAEVHILLNKNHQICGEPSPREQSGPVQFWSQAQVLLSASCVPCPEHWSGHMALASSQLAPPQPG